MVYDDTLDVLCDWITDAFAGLNFLDKVSISYASIMGLIDDIGISGSQYSWLGRYALLHT